MADGTNRPVVLQQGGKESYEQKKSGVPLSKHPAQNLPQSWRKS